MAYRVRIDGQVVSQTYSYEQLIETGIREFDDIYVQQVGDTEWHIAKYYDFPESHVGDQTDYEIDEFGQIMRKNEDNLDYEIDEFGQIRRKNVPEGTSSSSTSTGSTYTSSNSEGWKIFFKVLGTIAIIALTVVIIGATKGTTAPIAYGAWKGIQEIWKD